MTDHQLYDKIVEVIDEGRLPNYILDPDKLTIRNAQTGYGKAYRYTNSISCYELHKVSGNIVNASTLLTELLSLARSKIKLKELL